MRESVASVILTYASVLDTVLAVAEQVKIPRQNIVVLGETKDPQRRVKALAEPPAHARALAPKPTVPNIGPEDDTDLVAISVRHDWDAQGCCFDTIRHLKYPSVRQYAQGVLLMERWEREYHPKCPSRDEV